MKGTERFFAVLHLETRKWDCLIVHAFITWWVFVFRSYSRLSVHNITIAAVLLSGYIGKLYLCILLFGRYKKQLLKAWYNQTVSDCKHMADQNYRIFIQLRCTGNSNCKLWFHFCHFQPVGWPGPWSFMWITNFRLFLFQLIRFLLFSFQFMTQEDRSICY